MDVYNDRVKVQFQWQVNGNGDTILDTSCGTIAGLGLQAVNIQMTLVKTPMVNYD